MNPLIRGRVVPTISARTSWLIFGITGSVVDTTLEDWNALMAVNVTGVFLDAPDFSGKWIELLKSIVPDLSRAVVLWDPNPGSAHLQGVKEIARSLRLQLQVIEVRKADDIDRAFSAFRGRPQALIVLPSPMMFLQSERIAKLALKHRLPATSMIERRRCPRPTPGAVHTPSPSGPRCACASIISLTRAGSTGFAVSRWNRPAIPHMMLASLSRLDAAIGQIVYGTNIPQEGLDPRA